MITLPRYRRMLLLTEGRLGVFSSKTAASLLRYRADDVVGVLDSTCAGQSLSRILPAAAPRPIFARFDEARAAVAPDALIVGVAPVGGAMPAEMRRPVLEALRGGVDVVSGMHELLSEDAECVAAARTGGATIHDVRRAPPEQPIAAGRARGTRARRVLTVGTDCNVGKMAASLELSRTAAARGMDAAFVATGQTGIMIEGWGAAVDHVVCDFAAGVVESLVLHVAQRQIVFVEGQGSVLHPAYSGVSLSLLHGCCPDALILVHHAGRTHYRFDESIALPDLRTLIELHEAMARPLHSCRVVGVALNTVGLSDDAARRACEDVSRHVGLPATDVVRFGADPLLDACIG